MARTIAVTGKGGIGKTTVSALIIRHLRQHSAGPILALDADPDANLATVLGMPVETTIGDLREEVLREIRNIPAGMGKANYVEAGLHQLIVETPKVDLVTMGRGEGPKCYCFINTVLRKFADDLAGGYEWVVMDNEAGLEHLSRRTAGQIDFLIVVVNANPLSIDCARRIDGLLDELDRPVGRRCYVLNAVAPQRAEAVREKLAGLKLEYLGEVPNDDAVEQAILAGQSLYDLGPGPAVRAIEEIMQRMQVG